MILSRCPAPFRKIDVTRAVNACKDAKLDIARVEIDKDGKIVVVTTAGTTESGSDTDREIEQWRKQQHGSHKT